MFRRSSAAPAQPAPAPEVKLSESVTQSTVTNGSAKSPQPINNDPHLTNETAIAANQINNAAHHSRSNSIKPDGFLLPSIGIEGFVEQDELDEAPRLTAKDCMDPAVTADKLNRLSELVQELSVTSRDNNSILCQLLFTMEERMNKRIDSLREEMLALMDRKFELLAAEIQSTQQQQVLMSLPPTAKGRRASSFGLERNNSNTSTLSVGTSHGIATSGLGAVFESIDEGDNLSVRSKSSLAIPRAGSFAPGMSNSNSSGNSPSQLPPGMMSEEKTVTPHPGFVIKTRKMIGEKEKVFINVFHHETIEVIPHNLPKTISADQKPFLLFGSISHTLDNNGRNCSTYNVAVSSEYFKPDSTIDLKITAPASIQKIIHKVNLKNNEFFDENSYSLPRLANGYKGDELPNFIVPILVPVKIDHHDTAPSESTRASNFPKKMSIRENSRDDDGDSVISEITMRESETATGRRDSDTRRGSDAVNKHKEKGRKMTRKSIFDTSQLAINAGNIAGRNLLSGNMCEYVREESISGIEAEQLKEASVSDPYVLLGWQISLILENGETEVFVVTDVRKNYLSKTEYRLSRFYHDDMWVKLKRTDGKSGLDFRPLRKVLYGLQNDDDTVA